MWASYKPFFRFTTVVGFTKHTSCKTEKKNKLPLRDTKTKPTSCHLKCTHRSKTSDGLQMLFPYKHPKFLIFAIFGHLFITTPPRDELYLVCFILSIIITVLNFLSKTAANNLNLGSTWLQGTDNVICSDIDRWLTVSIILYSLF